MDEPVGFEQYYLDKYPEEYYSFDKRQLEIDPDEEFEDIEAYDVHEQRREIIKCAQSFFYFCHKYVKISHPIHKLVPFIPYKYQHRVVSQYEDHDSVILSKFRQGGLTTITVIWSLWRCLFKLDETIMVVSKSDREAIAAGEIVKRAIEELPNWMKPELSKNNDHQKIFADTGSKLFFYTPEAARGRSLTYLIIDEAAFIPSMEKHWKSLYPTLSTGGSCIVVSTVNGVGNWYEETYHQAEKGKNDFYVIDLDYWEHPDYDNEKWVRKTRANLGEKGWQQEVLRDFLGSGETYIPPDIINNLTEYVADIEPVRILFPEWNNIEEAREYRVEDMDSWVKGALHIWKERVEGRDYVIGVDVAEGIGEDGDSSCMEIIDAATCEQVAEFYSNRVPPNVFAPMISQIGNYFNIALVVVENLGPGQAVLNKLLNEIHYENIYHDLKRKQESPGIKTTKANRSVFLEGVQNRILNKTMVLNSRRFIKELKTFVYNKQTRRAEASPNFHDDAIMALSFAIYGRDKIATNVPVGADIPEELTKLAKSQVYEEIRAELSKNAPDSWFPEDNAWDIIEEEEEYIPHIDFKFKRNLDKLKKEFGW